MANATLMLHAGARHVDYEELAAVPTPEATTTWYPIGHATVLDAAVQRLNEAGYQIRQRQLALSRNNNQFFGTLKLDTTVVPGVSLAVGIRNSIDQTLPMGLVAGQNVFTCDNMAFRSELMVRRKHTRFGQMRFANAITEAIAALGSFAQVEATRIEKMQGTEVTTEKAESLILRAYLRQIVSFKLLDGIVKQWQRPQFEDWMPGTLWHIFNAFTFVMADMATKNPSGYANRTMQLNHLLCPLDGPGPQAGVIVEALAA